ncbi:Small-conductance mechanosensitive channel [Haladaptatus litoreus]|uniref:Small-conductance mechanosensitive channel n=1 Tax=Haladaptatus litoreus TaxID=553468 RepID=A0A1N6XH88_9EURY|nr:mechanosensitive ion channel family protein [Haladaptatus litoreus]SIR01640.1 Small-conductance mechanosensitive channel [Haladaptatus litoreus]
MAQNLYRQIGDLAIIDIRILITVFVALSIVAVLVLAWRGHPRLQEQMPDALANVIVIGSVTVFLILAGVTMLFLWEVVNTALIFPADWEEWLTDLINNWTGVKVTLTVVTLAIAYVAAGISKQAIERMTDQRDTFSRHQTQVMVRVAQVSIYVVGFAAVLGFWNVDLTGLLVGAGFLGIVVGMAARQTLGSLLAGFMLMFSRPFEIGDWVEIEENEGIVTDISIVNTRIQTFDGEFVMIPNEVVGGSTITNRSRKGRLRLEVDVGIDYEADVDRAAELAEEAMDDVEDALTVPSPQVVTKEFGDSAIVLGLRFWIDKPSARRKWRARTRVIGAVKDAYDGDGIKIPYPQRELSGRKETGGFQVASKQQRELGPTADGGEETGRRFGDEYKDDTTSGDGTDGGNHG